MALFYQEDLTQDTKLAIWHIEEEESFFLQKVSLNKAISHPTKRKQHLAGRFLLLHLFDDFPMSEIVIATSRKPYLQTQKFHFSISHCGDYAATIVSRSQRVGIDIEMFTHKVIRVQHKFLNQKEQQFLQNHNNSIRLATTLWSAKEAIYKWFNLGGVNFKENILLDAFDFKTQGTFDCRLLKDEKEICLETKYKLFQNLSLAYVSGEKKYPA